MTTLLELTKKLHNTLALYNGAGHALGWKTEKVDKLLDESKQVIELAEQPAQRTWVGLTDEEVANIISLNYPAYFDIAQAIEAKLKEKNA